MMTPQVWVFLLLPIASAIMAGIWVRRWWQGLLAIGLAVLLFLAGGLLPMTTFRQLFPLLTGLMFAGLILTILLAFGPRPALTRCMVAVAATFGAHLLFLSIATA